MSKHRYIPGTMATQHPDNANAPSWQGQGNPFIGFHQEIEEALHCYQEFGVSEYMWDWEGKHADAAVIDKLFSDHYDYFSKKQLGRDKFLTFRIPNIWEEKGYSLLQAMTVILTSEDFARDLKFDTRPLFEIILPMTESAQQLTHMQLLFEKLANFKSEQFTSDDERNTNYLELIPLVESVQSQHAIDNLLYEYVTLHERHFKKKPAYIRPFLARSDPALVSGLLATVIANKLALSRIHEFTSKTGIPTYPISGVGSLPFRGGLTPSTVSQYMKEYPGMRTVSIQSSFRYDHPLHAVKRAIATLERELPKTKSHSLSKIDQLNLEKISSLSESLYQESLSGIASDMSHFFASVPKRRDRRQHIGLLAYGRTMGQFQMPRAITFTGAFYSIGIPPEFIGLGRTLEQLTDSQMKLLRSIYMNLEADIRTAGQFLNKDNLARLALKNLAWSAIEQDVLAIEKIFNVTLGPKNAASKKHQQLSSDALYIERNHELLTTMIEQMAIQRNSLG